MVVNFDDFSDMVCAEKNVENIMEHWSFYGRSKRVIIEHTDELYKFDIGITVDDSPMAPQGVWWANLKPEVVDDRIDEIVEFFTSDRKPFWWYVCPSSKPDNLGEYLKAHNFNEMNSTPIMAARLRELIDDRDKPTQLTIEEVRDEESMRTLWDVWYTGYPMPEQIGKIFADICVEIGYSPDNTMKYYIGSLNGKPVATSWTVHGENVVGLYGVIVLPEARGKGIGTEMSLHPLRIARDSGYKIAVLDATQQGYGIYKRIGFKEVCTPKMYIYSSPEQESGESIMKSVMHTPRN